MGGLYGVAQSNIKRTDTRKAMQQASRESKAIENLRKAEASGKLNTDNPDALYRQLQDKYGEHAPDIVANCLNKPMTVMGEVTTVSKALNYFAQTEVAKVDEKKLGKAIGNERSASLLVVHAKEAERAGKNRSNNTYAIYGYTR